MRIMERFKEGVLGLRPIALLGAMAWPENVKSLNLNYIYPAESHAMWATGRAYGPQDPEA